MSKTSVSGRMLSLVLIVVGVLLLVFMISIEGEPGALPLLLTLSGFVWFAIDRYRRGRALRRKEERG